MSSPFLSYVINGLINKSDKIQLNIAVEFKNFMTKDLKDKSYDEAKLFLENMFSQFIQLINNNNFADKRAVLILMGCIVDLDAVNKHSSYRIMVEQIQDMPIVNNVEICALQSRLIAQINSISSPEQLKPKIKEFCNVLESEASSEEYRLFAAVMLKDIAFYCSTSFLPFATQVITVLLNGVRDQSTTVREMSAYALANAFAVITAKENLIRQSPKDFDKRPHYNRYDKELMETYDYVPLRDKVSQKLVHEILSNDIYVPGSDMSGVNYDWCDSVYAECLNGFLPNLDDENGPINAVNPDMKPDLWLHGTLLLLNELLKISNEEMELNRFQLEQIIDWPLKKLSASPWSAGVQSVYNACHMEWPCSGIEENIAKQKRKVNLSESCRKLLLSRIKEVSKIVLEFDTEDPYLVQLVMHAIPRIYALEEPNFQLKKYLEIIQRCIDKDLEKPLVYLAIGLLAHISPPHFAQCNYINPVIKIIVNNLPRKNVPEKMRQPCLDMSMYLITVLLATAYRETITAGMRYVLPTMLDADLSFPLIYSLKAILHLIPDLTDDIHIPLVTMLKKVLWYIPPRETQKASLNYFKVNDGEVTVSTEKLKPFLQMNIVPEQKDARNKIIALRALVELDFDNFNLSTIIQFISTELISNICCINKEIRIAAVKTTVEVLNPFLKDINRELDRNTAGVVSNVIDSLLIVSINDPEPDVRLSVFQSLDDRYDKYLCQSFNLSSLFVAVQDDVFEIRKLVVRILGRLSTSNLCCIKSDLRRILFQILCELKYTRSSRCKEQAACILGELILSAPSFIQPHSDKLLIILLPEIQYLISKSQPHFDNIFSTKSISAISNLKSSVSLTQNTSTDVEPISVQLAIIEAITNLAVVCSDKLKKYLDNIVPKLIYMMQDFTCLDKRLSAVKLLTKLISHTGYVVKPYEKYPELFQSLLKTLRTDDIPSIRSEVMKLLGTIGALDPLKQKLYCADYDTNVDQGIVVSVHDVIEKHEVDMSLEELFIDGYWSKLDDFYAASALQSLIQLLRDPIHRNNYAKICSAIISILVSLGSHSIPYLKQVFPDYFQCILNATDMGLQKSLLSQLCLISSVVKSHLKEFLPEIFDILLKLWNKSRCLTRVCVKVIRTFNQDLGSDVDPFVIPFIGVLQQTLSDTRNQSIPFILELLPELELAIKRYIHSLLPTILHLISKESLTKLETKLASLECIIRLIDKIDLSDSSSRIAQSLCQIFDPASCNTSPEFPNTFQSNITNYFTRDELAELLPLTFELFTALVNQMQQRSSSLAPHFTRICASVEHQMPNCPRIRSSIDKLNLALEESGRTIHLDEKSELNDSLINRKEILEIPTDVVVTPEANNNKPVSSRRVFRDEEFDGLLDITYVVTCEDWMQWFRQFSMLLLQESPNNAIRTCGKLSGCASTLSRSLFNASFISCWNYFYSPRDHMLIEIFETIITSCPSIEVSQIILNLREFIGRCNQRNLGIKSATLAFRSLINRDYAKALHYKEEEFRSLRAANKVVPQTLLFELLTINSKLQLKEATNGILSYSLNIYGKALQNEELWNEISGNYVEALNLYENQLADMFKRKTPPNYITLGRLRCLRALGDWGALMRESENAFVAGDPYIKSRTAPLIVTAAWNTEKIIKMNKYVEEIPQNNFDATFYRAVMSIKNEEFDEARDYIKKARDILDSNLRSLTNYGYWRDYNNLLDLQKLVELEEVIQFKLVKECRETIKQSWMDRLRGCQENVDDWQQILQIRNLALRPQQNMSSWIKYAGVARRNNRLEVTRQVLNQLNGRPLTVLSDDYIIKCDQPEISLSWAKYQWCKKQPDKAVNLLEMLMEQRLKLDIKAETTNRANNNHQLYDDLHLLAMKNLRAKCALQLGDWYRDIETGLSNKEKLKYHSKIIGAYRTATEEEASMKRSWYSWAMANYSSIFFRKTLKVKLNKQLTAVMQKWNDLKKRDSSDSIDKDSALNNTEAAGGGSGSSQQYGIPGNILKLEQPYHKFKEMEKLNNPSIILASSKVHKPMYRCTFGKAAAVLLPETEESTSDDEFNIDNLSDDLLLIQSQYTYLKRQRDSLIQEIDTYSVPAVYGFINSISLSSAPNLQDCLRLITLLNQFGHIPKVRQLFQEEISKIKLENWLPVIQQLMARLDSKNEYVTDIIVNLLIRVGERHPHALINPLVLAFKSGGSDIRRYNATKILHSMERHSPRLVAEGFMLNEELMRLSITMMELWCEAFEVASRLYYEDRNITGMFKVLYPYHLLMEQEIKTLHDVAFYNECYHDLFTAKNLCIKYENSLSLIDVTNAWKIYSGLYRKWNKIIMNLKVLELHSVSSILHDYNEWVLSIPGSYSPNKPVVTISRFKNLITVMPSKQHPRQLSIIGSDGQKYMFLLKGHEDNRQDERVIQFFGLINTLLANNRQTYRSNLSIQTMSVIPLSTNSGLIGWVPNCDTMCSIIKYQREKYGVPMNIEHKEMIKMAGNYDNLNILKKCQVFEASLGDGDSRELADYLWLKSPSAEIWFERRTNFIRSLAVMSMVGYILGLGDRHPSNILVRRDSGKVTHVDFGDCFDVALYREMNPEKVPFRLTRMLIGALEVTGINGLFRQTCIQIVDLMRRNRESLLAVLEAFIHDPLLHWITDDTNEDGVLGNNPMKSKEAGAGASKHVRIYTDGNYPYSHSLRNPNNSNRLRQHLMNGPWYGCYKKALKLRKQLIDGSTRCERNQFDGMIFSPKPKKQDLKSVAFNVEDDWEGANERAMEVVTRIHEKLEGKEALSNMSVEEQVDMLIKEATSNHNLCQMYVGWCPFW